MFYDGTDSHSSGSDSDDNPFNFFDLRERRDDDDDRTRRSINLNSPPKKLKDIIEEKRKKLQKRKQQKILEMRDNALASKLEKLDSKIEKAQKNIQEKKEVLKGSHAPSWDRKNQKEKDIIELATPPKSSSNQFLKEETKKWFMEPFNFLDSPTKEAQLITKLEAEIKEKDNIILKLVHNVNTLTTLSQDNEKFMGDTLDELQSQLDCFHGRNIDALNLSQLGSLSDIMKQGLEQIKNRKKELKALQKKTVFQECSICFEAEVNSVFLECKHQICCYTCSQKVDSCPICRMKVVRVIQVFRS